MLAPSKATPYGCWPTANRVVVLAPYHLSNASRRGFTGGVPLLCGCCCCDPDSCAPPGSKFAVATITSQTDSNPYAFHILLPLRVEPEMRSEDLHIETMGRSCAPAYILLTLFSKVTATQMFAPSNATPVPF